jgi:DNA-directed RNA polymerase specialized sigma24 family protein
VINAAHDVWRIEAQVSTSSESFPDRRAIGVNGSGSSLPLDPEVARVRDALRQLPQRQRDALFLRFYLGLDYAAVADVLGVEVGTVSASLHSARESLAKTLKEVAR